MYWESTMENENQIPVNADENVVQQPEVQEEMITETAAADMAAASCCESADEDIETGRNEDDIQEESAAPAKSSRPQIVVTQEMLDVSSKTLAIMFDYLGLDASIKSEGRNSKINLLVSSEETGRIIGRKGQSLEALQLLLNRMMQKNDPDFPKVYIDIDGYSSKGSDRKREDRGEAKRNNHGRKGSRNSFNAESGSSSHENILRQQAIDASKEVRRWGEPVTLQEMNAHDRRIIHITLENESDIQTESIGDGAKKSVVISLKK